MKKEEYLSEGRQRQCYTIDEGRTIVKKLKPLRLGLTSLFSHYISNPNIKELNAYRKVPVTIKKYFVEYTGDLNGVYSKRILNSDNTPSLTLESIGKVQNKRFWSILEEIKNECIKSDFFILDVFGKGDNILVQKISEEEIIPVIIDYKRIGRSAYPLQLNLLINNECRKKINRKFQRLKSKYKA